MSFRRTALATLAIAMSAAGLASCGRDAVDEAPDAAPSAPTAPVAPTTAPTGGPAPTTADADAGQPPRDRLVVIAGGDVSLGRILGKMLLKDPELDLFPRMHGLLDAADVRFVNLESQLSDQNGETESPDNVLVFVGPPAGADALAKARFDVVSLANNHAWDYGKKALFETFDNLDRTGIKYVGAGRNREEAYRPLVIDKEGFRLAFLAVTDIWNQGVLSKHPGAEYVARADPVHIAEAVRKVRADPSIDAIAVSYHGGSEYIDMPLTRTKEILRAAIDAGADVVFGHHPHVIHGVEWRAGKPIFYSLGNFLMRMHSNHRWTGLSFLARVRLERGKPPVAEACPFRIHGVEVIPFGGDPQQATYERTLFDHLSRISKYVGGTTIGPSGADGCAPLSPPEAAVASTPLAER